MGAWLYILRCADRSSRADLEQRVAEHQSGHFGGSTATRRPVELVFSDHFDTIADAISAERQIKGWSRAKKEALIAGGFSAHLRVGKEAKHGPTPWFETRRYAPLLTMRPEEKPRSAA